MAGKPKHHPAAATKRSLAERAADKIVADADAAAIV
jgi:hypothetical protein